MYKKKINGFLTLLFGILRILVISSDLHQIFTMGFLHSRFYSRAYSGELVAWFSHEKCARGEKIGIKQIITNDSWNGDKCVEYSRQGCRVPATHIAGVLTTPDGKGRSSSERRPPRFTWRPEDAQEMQGGAKVGLLVYIKIIQ